MKLVWTHPFEFYNEFYKLWNSGFNFKAAARPQTRWPVNSQHGIQLIHAEAHEMKHKSHSIYLNWALHLFYRRFNQEIDQFVRHLLWRDSPLDDCLHLFRLCVKIAFWVYGMVISNFIWVLKIRITTYLINFLLIRLTKMLVQLRHYNILTWKGVV